MLRLFTAIDIPEAARERLSLIAGGVPGARWVPAGNLHITLRFIGEVEETLLADIRTALAEIEVPPFELTLKGMDIFGNRHEPKVLWAGVDRTEMLARLYRRIETGLGRAGIAPERRKFHPHVTLARLRRAPAGKVAAFLSQNALLGFAPFRVESFSLYESILGSEGSVYRERARFPLV